MKKVITILLLTLTLPVLADHHRDHALENLYKAKNAAFWSEYWMDRYAVYVSDDVLVSHFDDARWYYTILGVLLDDAIASVECACDQLDAARARINQPNLEPGTPNSALRNAKRIVEKLNTFNMLYTYPEIADHPSPNFLVKASQNGILLWQFLDLAAWHVNDAIREEIYLDPVFICSGPGNHCE